MSDHIQQAADAIFASDWAIDAAAALAAAGMLVTPEQRAVLDAAVRERLALPWLTRHAVDAYRAATPKDGE